MLDKQNIMTQSLTQAVLSWYKNNKRALPWRENTEPYPVWLSEIILQQTQVKQGYSYFQNIISAFPTVAHLANVSTDVFYTYWAGLGYYSRARNILKTAKIIQDQHKGVFPNSKAELLKLPGIGDYTASAIASICFNESVLALDGNLMRVFSRIMAFDKDLKLEKNKKELKGLAEFYLPIKNAGDFNQALMDLGASICTKSNAKCMDCPIVSFCSAKAKGIQAQLPIKSKMLSKEKIYIHFFINNDYSVFVKRREKGIWHNLYELPAIWLNETGKEIYNNGGLAPNLINNGQLVWQTKHLLTHKILNIRIYKVNTEFDEKFREVNLDNLSKYALPRPLSKFLTVD